MDRAVCGAGVCGRVMWIFSQEHCELCSTDLETGDAEAKDCLAC